MSLQSESTLQINNEDPWENNSWGTSIHIPQMSDSEWYNRYGDWCGCCLRLSDSDIVAIRQSEELFASDMAAESPMNAAGRTAMHPFRDLRSAAYTSKRARKFSKEPVRARSVAGRKWEKADRRRSNKRRKRDVLRDELLTNQRQEKLWIQGQPKKFELVFWDTQLEEDFDEHIENMNDDVIRYEKLHKKANFFESPEPYTEVGEIFSTWAQRRIAEMRAVKESRLHRNLAQIDKPGISKTLRFRNLGSGEFNYHIYSGHSSTTTLPTNSYDAYGHALLRNVLTPSLLLQRQARFNPKVSLFRCITGYHWFGEYTWRWHRNGSGCWEIGYDDCDGGALPCPCCNSGSGSMYYSCSCSEFGNEPAPDEQQRCSLVEWVDAESRRLMDTEDRDVNGGGLDNSDAEWSVVDGDWGVQSCSSVSSSII